MLNKTLIKFKLLPLLLLVFVQFSCSRRKIQKSIAELPKIEIGNNEIAKPDSIVSEFEDVNLIISESSFEYLKLKSKIDFHSENLSQSFPANVHVKKDSVIWISVSVGIEAARCLITQDSILFMDRINRKHYGLSIAELSQQFNFEFDFGLLQSLLIGNLPFKKKKGDEVVLNSLYTSLFQQANNIKIENQVDNVNRKLTTILAEDIGGKSKLGISYSDFFKEINGQVVPHAIFAKIDVIKTDQIKTSTLDFKHTKIEFSENELRFPYTIPKSYEKGEIAF
jgi:Fe-S cluster assembly iron-binding protein IscA